MKSLLMSLATMFNLILAVQVPGLMPGTNSLQDIDAAHALGLDHATWEDVYWKLEAEPADELVETRFLREGAGRLTERLLGPTRVSREQCFYAGLGTGDDFTAEIRRRALETLELTEADFTALTSDREEAVQPLANPDAWEDFERRTSAASVRLDRAIRRTSRFVNSPLVVQIRLVLTRLRGDLALAPGVVRGMSEGYEAECNRELEKRPPAAS